MEIGSIFEIDISSLLKGLEGEIPKLPFELGKTLRHYYFNTGRAAIEAILIKLRERGYRELLLPSYLCDSVRDAALRANMDIVYYEINTDLSVNINSIKYNSDSILYLVQYFGKEIDEELLDCINQAKHQGVMVIEDISLSLLSKNEKCVGFGDYVIGSLRKWFPIVDGGVILSEREENFELSTAAYDYTLDYFVAQILKSVYLNSCTDNDNKIKEVFLSYNAEGMKALFSDYTIRKMSRLSLELLRGIDVEEVKKQRIKNYDYLYSLLSTVPQIKVIVKRQGEMVPLGMVIAAEDRNELLNYLISHGVYCNVHWRCNESIKESQASQHLAERCITIPCDQRYGEEAMQYIYKCIREYYGE